MIDNDPILWTMLNAIKEQNAEIEAQDCTEPRRTRRSGGSKSSWRAYKRMFVLSAESQQLPRERAVAKAKR